MRGSKLQKQKNSGKYVK